MEIKKRNHSLLKRALTTCNDYGCRVKQFFRANVRFIKSHVPIIIVRKSYDGGTQLVAITQAVFAIFFVLRVTYWTSVEMYYRYMLYTALGQHVVVSAARNGDGTAITAVHS